MSALKFYGLASPPQADTLPAPLPNPTKSRAKCCGLRVQPDSDPLNHCAAGNDEAIVEAGLAHGQPIEVVSTLTGLNTPSGPFKNQTAKLLLLPFVKVTLKALLTRPGWKTVVWPRF